MRIAQSVIGPNGDLERSGRASSRASDRATRLPGDLSAPFPTGQGRTRRVAGQERALADLVAWVERDLKPAGDASLDPVAAVSPAFGRRSPR